MADPQTINTAALDALASRFEAENAELCAQLEATAQKVLIAARTIGESWSGSNMGYHALLYCRDFRKPPIDDRFNVEWGLAYGIPDGWADMSVEAIEAQIESLSDVNLKAFSADVKALGSRGKEMSDELLLELTAAVAADASNTLKMLAGQIQAIKWDRAERNDYLVNVMNACPRMTRDFEAINSGRRVPAHSFWEAEAVQATAWVTKARDTVKLIRKFIRRAAIEPAVPEGMKAIAMPAVVSVRGDHARINIQSTDRSVNVVGYQRVFDDIRSAIEGAGFQTNERERLIAEVDELQHAHNQGDYTSAYQKFISVVADHLTIILPFLPQLTKLLGA